MEIDRYWSLKIKSKGLVVVEKLKNVVLRLEMEKDNISTNQATLSTEKAKSEECVSLLKMVIQIKANELVESKILPKGDGPLFELQ